MKSSDIRTIERIKYRRDVLDIRWRVTTLCNYQCDFCIQGDRKEHLRQAKGESLELRTKICDEIVKLVNGLGTDYRMLKIGLIGGEVTILDDFPEILEKLAGCDFPGEMRFSITTNFSADIGYLQRMLDQFRKGAGARTRTFLISASYYPQYVPLEQFSSKLQAVAAYGGARRRVIQKLFRKLGMKTGDRFSLSAGIPIVNDNDYEEYVRLKGRFKATAIRISPIIIRNYQTSLSEKNLNDIIDREEKQLRVTDVNDNISFFPSIQSLGASLECTDSFCPTGYLCEAGMRSFWIDAFRNVKRCPALRSTMSMGSILDGSFRLLESPQICTSDHCSCGVPGKIYKP